jgi:hypothetical protein
VKDRYEGSPEHGIFVNGAPMEIYTDNASYMSRDTYKRITSIRKSKNRFMALSHHSYRRKGGYIVKVYINKEMETSKIKAKIDAAIEDYKQKELTHENNKRKRESNINTVAMHYLNDDVVLAETEQILIEKGVISFQLKNRCATIFIQADGKLIDVTIHKRELKSLEEMKQYTATVSCEASIAELVLERLMIKEPLSEELIAWITTMHHGYFYINTMSTENKIG